MPAYGKQISPAEMTALVAFLVSLRPEGQPPARPADDAPTDAEGIPVSPTLDAFLRSWPFEPWLWPAAAVGRVYLHGWLVLRRRDPRRWPRGRLAAFLGGLAAIFLALASPIEPFAGCSCRST